MSSQSSQHSGFPAKDDPQLRPKRTLAHYGAPPAAWKQSNHYYHFGWPVDQNILRRALLKLPMDLPTHKEYAGSLCSRLELLFKFHGINAILCKPDEFCESQGRAFSSRDDGRRYVQFITIGCTCSRKYFWRRPDTETMEDLISIIGERPRWLENASTKQNFGIGLLA